MRIPSLLHLNLQFSLKELGGPRPTRAASVSGPSVALWCSQCMQIPRPAVESFQALPFNKLLKRHTGAGTTAHQLRV